MLSKCLSVVNFNRFIRLPRRKMTDLITRFERLSLNDTSYVGKETQVHGFVWEREVGSILGASVDEMKSISYTSPTDLPSHFNRKHGVDNHCKTTGSQLVCMGSALNTFDHLDRDKTHLTIIQYVQRDGWKIVKNTYQLDLTGMRLAFFGDITREDLSELEDVIKSIPPGRLDKSERERIYNRKKMELQSRSSLIKLNPKVDSKTQRRLQCSFNLNDFLNTYPTRCIQTSVGNRFYDGYITPKIQSGRRKLKRRNDK